MTGALEIVVVGAGPAGLSAALAAAEAGAQVTVLDGYARPGGQYYRQPPERPGVQPTRRQREGRELWQRAVQAGADIRPDTLVWDLSADKTLACRGPQGVFLLRAAAVILATGPYERAAAFPGWTLPGVLLTGGAQTLLYQHARPGTRVLLAGTGPLQLVVARKLLEAGVEVAAVLEGSRLLPQALAHLGAAWGQWEKLWEAGASLAALATHGVPYRRGWGIVEAHGLSQVEGATIARLDAGWRPIPGSQRQIACDTICIEYGMAPFNALARLAGAAHAWRPDLGGEAPLRSDTFETSVPGIYAAGDGAGIGGNRLSLLEGRVAGIAAAAAQGHGKAAAAQKIRTLEPALKRERAFQRMYSALFTPGEGIYELAGEDTLLCRCEGVTLGMLRCAVEGGAGNIINIKSATRAGMGECQGRTCGHLVSHCLARLTGHSVPEAGLYNPRPPVFPVPIGELAQMDSDTN